MTVQQGPPKNTISLPGSCYEGREKKKTANLKLNSPRLTSQFVVEEGEHPKFLDFFFFLRLDQKIIFSPIHRKELKNSIKSKISETKMTKLAKAKVLIFLSIRFLSFF